MDDELFAQEHDDAAEPEASDSGMTSLPGSDRAAEPSLQHGDAEEETVSGHALPFPVVGIGGSAGAVEVFIEFFHQLPADTGMTFVVLLHLAAQQESHMVAILQRHTVMPVLQITDGTTLAPNRVYVLPPNGQVTMEGDRFRLQPRERKGPFLPIDAFFISLAAAQKNFAIGIVLSGMDGDGTTGLRAIKGEGGFSMVQSPETARYGDMPRASIAGDHVDLVLPPEMLASSVASYGRRFSSKDWRRIEEGQRSVQEDRYFEKIIRLLVTVSGLDFRLYKQTTVHRRIARRMLLHKMESLQAYITYLQANPSELRDLQEDILINVTRFFRDPDLFEALRTVFIPRMIEERQADQQIRVWVPGCSSGEEVYSIAMCLLEYLTGQSIDPGIQIFGTDASEVNIQKARLGVYAESTLHDVTPERLRRFFSKTEKGFQISKRVRDLCIFARQNLSTDPPFSRLDLVSCRNVLIYFGPQLQRQVMSTFHYALRPRGLLVLGSSETIREFTDMFTTEDRTSKVFMKTGETAGRTPTRAFSPTQYPNPGSDASSLQVGQSRRDFDLGRLADRIILARYGPPAVVINDQMEILQSRGRTSPFIEMAQGSASLQLSRMTRESIANGVIAAVRSAIEQDMPVQVDGLRLAHGNENRVLRIEVLPMHAGNAGARFYLLAFLPDEDHFARPEPMLLAPGAPIEGERSMDQLQHALASTKLYLQSLLDERDSKNQELISANEEIQSANEELQSTNEELETTKEELQSSNEELQTVNDELSSRNSVLMQASNDLSNLLNSVNLPVLMLSNDLTIRHFTPQTQKLMSVRSSDIGRPFHEIRLNLELDNLESRLREVLETLTAQEMEVQDREGRWYLLRVRPYRTTDNKIDGLVVVMVDVDQQRKSQQQLRDARDFAASVIASVPLPLVVVSSVRKIQSLNDAFCTLTGLGRQALEGRDVTHVVAGLWNMEASLRAMLKELQNDGKADSRFEYQYLQPDKRPCTLLVRGRPLRPDGEQFQLITFEDISAHTEVQDLLKREGERLSTQVATTTRELDRSREELRALTDMLMTSQEDERRRLARELHDDVSQRLALLDLDVAGVLADLESDAGPARPRVESMRGRIAEISQDVRTLSHRLHPSIIEHLGAATALESLLDEFARHDSMLTSFFSAGVPDDLPLDVATGLYRIAQEALRNASKHAGKAHVKVSLVGKAEELTLEIADSGAGFDPAAQSAGLGLVSMKERARLIGATLTVHAAPRQGTRVEVHVPLSQNSHDS